THAIKSADILVCTEVTDLPVSPRCIMDNQRSPGQSADLIPDLSPENGTALKLSLSITLRPAAAAELNCLSVRQVSVFRAVMSHELPRFSVLSLTRTREQKLTLPALVAKQTDRHQKTTRKQSLLSVRLSIQCKPRSLFQHFLPQPTQVRSFAAVYCACILAIRGRMLQIHRRYIGAVSARHRYGADLARASWPVAPLILPSLGITGFERRALCANAP
ncbi:hypothetical protein BaRGS_00029076, partial [Batillaria attramentaria]